jgi:hypothetical protein
VVGSASFDRGEKAGDAVDIAATGSGGEGQERLRK